MVAKSAPYGDTATDFHVLRHLLFSACATIASRGPDLEEVDLVSSMSGTKAIEQDPLMAGEVAAMRL